MLNPKIPSVPLSGNYDNEDTGFEAGVDCCACGGGKETPPAAAFREDWTPVDPTNTIAALHAHLAPCDNAQINVLQAKWAIHNINLNLTRIQGVLASEENKMKAEQQVIDEESKKENNATEEIKIAAHAIQSKPFYLLLLLWPPRYH